MPGGRRPGGIKTGGRQKGSLNRKTIAKIAMTVTGELGPDEEIDPLVLKNISPVDTMLFVMRLQLKNKQWAAAQAAARDAAPYLHARLSNVTQDVNIKRSLAEYTTEELEALVTQAAVNKAIAGAKDAEVVETTVGVLEVARDGSDGS